MSHASPLALADAQPGAPYQVASIVWDALSEADARRLREFGLDSGVEIELLHRSALGGGPIACRIGRMTIAMRRAVAGSIRIEPLPC